MDSDTARFRKRFEADGLSPATVRLFKETILAHYRRQGRSLPWRTRRSAYRVVVSEVMLQQTQVDRVVEKYAAFIRVFPDFASLAAAPLGEVLRQWQGLGYNRRAIALRRLAVEVMTVHGGRLPRRREVLMQLPGIGGYTAAAVRAFAFNEPDVMIETNIRSVFLHFFFADQKGVSDAAILPLVEATLDRDEPRQWYNALMDYGVMLKKRYANPSRRSAHHQRQSPFAGSNRQLRGRILRLLLARPGLTTAEMAGEAGCATDRVDGVLTQLAAEGFIVRRGRRYFLP